MNMRDARPGLVMLCLLLAASPAMAETLYKMVDKKGKVTYGEKPPKDFDGQVTRMEIDPNANTATLPKAPPPPARKAGPDQPVGIKVRTRADIARENVDKARKALTEARDNPADTDFRFIANAGGGTRRVPTDSYLARVAGLEAALAKAEAEASKYEEKK
jgi:hypothetical protein